MTRGWSAVEGAGRATRSREEGGGVGDARSSRGARGRWSAGRVSLLLLLLLLLGFCCATNL